MVNNYLTEAEAAKRWCPFSRTIEREENIHSEEALAAAATNRGGLDGSFGKAESCLGGRCMAWRWARDARLTFYAVVLDDHGRPYEAANNPPPAAHIERTRKDMSYLHAPYEAWTAEPEFDDEDGRWKAKWKREADPARPGYCGLAENVVICQGGRE